MSRFFSSAARAAKCLKWELNGTTQNVQGQLAKIETALDKIPELAGKVEKGAVNGDPHPTPHKDGTVDPIHLSGVLGKGNLKRSKRATSFHWYPETGDLVFSNPKYAPVRLDPSITVAESSSSAQSAGQMSAHQQALDWEWDDGAQKYRYWNGLEWVWQKEN